MGGGGAGMIRLEEKPFELDGKRYLLRCNMAVLETIEELHGDFEAIMQLPVRAASLDLLAAMLNEYAEDQGWDERWTVAQLKKRISYAMLMELDLVGMLFRSLTPRDLRGAAAGQPEPGPVEGGN